MKPDPTSPIYRINDRVPGPGPGGARVATMARISEGMVLRGPRQEPINVPAGALLNLDEQFVQWKDAAGVVQKLAFQMTERPSVSRIGFDYQQRPGDFFTPGELENWLAGYPMPEYRGEQMSQRIDTKGRDIFKHRTFGLDMAFDRVNDLATYEDAPQEVSPKTTVTQDQVGIHRLATFVPREAERQATYAIAQTNLALVNRLMRQEMEFAIMTMLTTSGSWSSGYYKTLTSGYQWGALGGGGEGVLSNPILDIDAMIEQTPTEIKEFWIRRDVMQAFFRHSAVMAYVKAMGVETQFQTMQKENEKNPNSPMDFFLPGKGQFRVHTAKYRNAGTLTYIMPPALIGLVQTAGMPTTGFETATSYNFTRMHSLTGQPFGTREVLLETRGDGGRLIIVEAAYLPKFLGSIFGGVTAAVLQ